MKRIGRDLLLRKVVRGYGSAKKFYYSNHGRHHMHGSTIGPLETSLSEILVFRMTKLYRLFMAEIGWNLSMYATNSRCINLSQI